MEILAAILISSAAVAAVLYPVVRAERTESDPAAAPPEGEAGLDAEVARYRDAVRSNTACTRCGLANPPGSRFCAECGRLLEARSD